MLLAGLIKKTKVGSVRRSTGAMAKNRARVLKFHQDCEELSAEGDQREVENTVSWLIT